MQALGKYAPASDGNDPVRYAGQIAESLGVSTETVIGDLDDDQMIVVQNKITEVEGAIPGGTLAYDSPDLPPELVELLP